MFKIFKNHVCLYVLTAFIICFVQTVESHAESTEDRFQEVAPFAVVVAKGKNIVPVDMAIIRGAGGQDEFAFGKTEKVSYFKAFWGCVGFISVLSSLLSSDLIGVVASLIGLIL
ncbi:Uncharacterised protein [Candidatus Bartonella washoeensis]|uniref:Uncharacterized protein n=1 Tax=Candidatus Bartonella washoeensis Sb944nv TaxID=1094563 RepID=J0Q1C9_9HYPH|nr:hypothetical protein [Bartonella washoeensis]EJF78801.1 hypothetical protein MCQ_01180 [Bartonella washoeensis Sb944nv]SPU27282.1 Uncharacterised protein [Bartonella washoeensis]